MDGRSAGGIGGSDTVLTHGGGEWTAQELPPGTVVGGHEIEGVAGRGGMGVVYRARDLQLGRTVALKLIGGDRAEDPERRALFIRESLTAASLEHPNALPLYRAGEDDGRLFIAMRFVDGASLAELIDASPGGIPPGRAARIVARVADALDAAHAKGLVHRDVKPGNILVADPDGDEHVYLSDFGLTVGDGAGVRPGGGWAGTLAYLAPEQIRGETLDARTDVYALGCVLFHALTGRPPFTGDEAEVLRRHESARPPVPSEVVPGLPPAFDAVVRRAMAKRPEDRFATAGELGRAALDARYDVALLVAPGDRATADRLAAGLRDAELVPLVAVAGEPSAAEGIRAAGACAVLVGRGGLDEWARDGLAAARRVATHDRAFRKVLVLLPGAPGPDDPSLAFLADHPWVDLRAGVGDALATTDVVRALREADVPPGLPPAEGVAPYRGLEAFREDDAPFYFGREQDVARVLERLRTGRFIAVVGPSGSGKSSLVFAGVLPVLRRGDDAQPPRLLEMVPGAHPLAALAARLGQLPGAGAPSAADLAADERALDLAVGHALGGRPSEERVVLVVDQLEEAVTLCADEAERDAFLGQLAYAATIPGGRTVVIATMRADFYHRLAEHPDMRRLIASHQVLLGPLDARALRRTIEEPARRAGLTLEPGLTRRILTDVADRPGTLPLLEHLLLEVWSRRRDRTLTLEAYAASGGVEGALARRANEAYGAMTPERQAIARRVLLRLTQPGEGTEDTRRRAERRELVTDPSEEGEVNAVVDALAAARLVATGTDDATGEPVVEVTHEALIRGWPELRGWLDEDRDRLRAERRLTDAAAEWDRGGREEGALYRGARLAWWAERDTATLNPVERDFLVASNERAERDRQARRKRVRIAIASLSVALAAIAAVAIYALVQRNDASNQRDLALSRQLATESQAELSADPELAALIASAGYTADASPQAEAALRQAVHDSSVRGSLRLNGQLPLSVTSTGDGRVAVGTDAGALTIWNPTADPRGVSPEDLGKYAGGVNMVVRSRDGYLTGGNDGAVVEWPLSASGGGPREVAHSKGAVYRVRVVPDGNRVVTSGDAGIFEHDLASGRTKTIATGLFFDVAFDPVTGGVITTDPAGELLRWRPGTKAGERIPIPGTAQVLGVRPDGRVLGVGTGQGLVILELAEKPHVLVSKSFSGGVNGVAFGPEGLIAAAGGDGSVRVLDGHGKVLARLTGHQGPVADVTFLGRDRVISTGVDGSTRSWAWADAAAPTLESGPLPGTGGVAFVRDAVRVVAGDGSVSTWTPSDAAARPLLPATPGGAAQAAVSPDGRFVATTTPDGTLLVRNGSGAQVGKWTLGHSASQIAWLPADRGLAAALLGGDVTTVALTPGSRPEVLGKHAEDALVVAVRPSDGVIASGGRDGVIRLWDGTEGGRLIADHDAQINALAFDADGRHLAAAVGDQTVRVYDVTGQDPPTTLRGRFGEAYALGFGDGPELVTGGERGLRIWDWRRGVILLTVPRAQGVLSLSVTGPQPNVASYGYDNTVHITNCDVCGFVAGVERLLAQRTTRTLTPGERTDFQVSG